MAGKKQAAYKLPEKAVSVTIPPGGSSALKAVMKAKSPTYKRVDRNAAVSDRDGLHKFTMSLSQVDAVTSNTLSSDDIAAAIIATIRKATTAG